MDVMHNLESADPIDLFRQWLAEAERSEPNDANAAALATSTPDGSPSVRMVLVKRADERGFCFFTNAKAGRERSCRRIPGQPSVFTGSRYAARCEWRAGSARCRMRMWTSTSTPGPATARSEPPFRSRAGRSPAARNWTPRFRKFAEEHPGEVPRPPYWRGFCVHAGADRVLDKRRQPPPRPALVYPRCRRMENNPAIPVIRKAKVGTGFRACVRTRTF